jgi:membrane protease YdiL (CAAX protease family)
MSRLIGPWRALAVLVLAYAVLNTGLQLSRPALAAVLHLSTPMQTAAFRLAGSSVFLWLMLAVVALIMRARGGRLADLGLRRPGAIAGWIAAAIVCALQIAQFLIGPVGHSPWLSDWSGLRIGSAVMVAVSAGVCEETIFRGFVMTQAKQAGLPLWAQILASALLFGAAHAGWGFLSGEGNLAATIGAMVATGILGGLLGVAYALAKRSLWPVIIAHGLIDLVAEPWLILFALSGGFTGHPVR